MKPETKPFGKLTVDPLLSGQSGTTVVRIYEMSVTMNQLLNALIQHISVL